MKLFQAFLLPCTVLASGSVSVSIKDLGAVQSANIESLNIQGSWDTQFTDCISGKASYTFNKARFKPSSLGLSSRTETALGKLKSTLHLDPQDKIANLDWTLFSRRYGAFSTSYKASDKTSLVLGPLKWTSNSLDIPFAAGARTPMVINASHDITTKEGCINIGAKLSNNFDGKMVLPSSGDPVITIIGSHSPDKDSDIRVSASLLDLTSSGIGKGAIGMTYRRDLDAVPGSTSRVTLEGKDTGDYAWSLSNTTKRMTLVLSGRGRFAPRSSSSAGFPSTVSLRQSFRLF